MYEIRFRIVLTTIMIGYLRQVDSSTGRTFPYVEYNSEEMELVKLYNSNSPAYFDLRMSSRQMQMQSTPPTKSPGEKLKDDAGWKWLMENERNVNVIKKTVPPPPRPPPTPPQQQQHHHQIVQNQQQQQQYQQPYQQPYQQIEPNVEKPAESPQYKYQGSDQSMTAEEYKAQYSGLDENRQLNQYYANLAKQEGLQQQDNRQFGGSSNLNQMNPHGGERDRNPHMQFPTPGAGAGAGQSQNQRFPHQTGHFPNHHQNNRPGSGHGHQGQNQKEMIRGPNGQFHRNPHYQGPQQFNPEFGPNSNNHPNHLPHAQAQVQILDLNHQNFPQQEPPSEVVYSYDVEFEYVTKNPNEIRQEPLPDNLDMEGVQPLWYQKLHPEIYGLNPENRPENQPRFSPLPIRGPSMNNAHPEDMERLQNQQSDDQYRIQEHQRQVEEMDRGRDQYYIELNKKREETARKNAELERQRGIQEAFERQQREEEESRQKKKSPTSTKDNDVDKKSDQIVSKEDSVDRISNSKDDQEFESRLSEKLPTPEKEVKKTNHHHKKKHDRHEKSDEEFSEEKENSKETDLEDDKSNQNKLYFTSSVYKLCIIVSIHLIMVQ